jgi:hypothetical protein
MQLIYAVSSTLFVASTAFAAPIAQQQGAANPGTVTISFINSQAGSSVPVIATLNGLPIFIGQYLANSPITQGYHGPIYASQAQVVARPESSWVCKISRNGANSVFMNKDAKSYVNFGFPIDIGSFILECWA